MGIIQIVGPTINCEDEVLKDSLLLGLMMDTFVSCLGCSSSGVLALASSGFFGGLSIFFTGSVVLPYFRLPCVL